MLLTVLVWLFLLDMLFLLLLRVIGDTNTLYPRDYALCEHPMGGGGLGVAQYNSTAVDPAQ